MRSFLTRLPRVVLGALCLPICLACATPFPIENLKEGMAAETVRENFGAPEAIENEPGAVESSWVYVDEEQVWFMTVILSTAFLPHCTFFSALTMPFGADWCGPFHERMVEEKPLVLHFEEEKLVRWEVLEPVRREYNHNSALTMWQQDQWFRDQQMTRDYQHHKKGHTHHHHPDC